MVTGPALLIIFTIAIVLVIVLIVKFKVNPFIALLLVTIFTGLSVNMPVESLANNITIGFGNTMKGIGIVIALGVVLGKTMSVSGATEIIAKKLVKTFGERNAPLALNLTGFLICIPVFFDAAYVILISLIKKTSKVSKAPFITLVTSLAIGGLITHNMIIPTPGPVAVGESFKLGSGPFVLYSLIIALPASLAGWIYSKYLGKKKKLFAVEEEEEEGQLNENKPSVLISFTVLLLPILLILFGTVFAKFLSVGSFLSRIFSFFGDKNIALLIGVLFALVALKRYYIKSANELINQAIGSAGMILMITGVGGSFGTIINQSGIGEYLVYSLTSLNMPLLLVGFLLAAIFRGAQGSSTVALITAATILAPSVLNTPGVNPYMVAIAITLGGMCCSFPNDSGFWVVSKFSNLSVKQTLLSWTIGNSLAGIAGFILLLIINTLL